MSLKIQFINRNAYKNRTQWNRTLTEMSTKVNEKLKNFIFSVTSQYKATHLLKHIVFLN